MIKIKYKLQKNSIKFVSILFIFCITVSTVRALALSTAPSNHNANYNVTTKNQTSIIPNQLILNSSQLKNCLFYQSSIVQLINNIDTRVQNQISLFSTTSLRVDSFYNLQGKKLSNYPDLIDAISASQAKVNGDFENLKSFSNFSCKMNNPTLAIKNFQNILKNQIEDMSIYRTNIDNFIIALENINNIVISTNK